MRMWMVDPKIMCRAHLLGEHRELHALAGMLRQGISLAGYHANGLLDLGMINLRHDELVAEIRARSYAHHTPLEINPHVYTNEPLGHVDRSLSFIELVDRCSACATRSSECRAIDC